LFFLVFLFDLLLGDIDPLLSSGSFISFTNGRGGERMVFLDYGFAPNPRLRYAELGPTCLLCVLRHPRPGEHELENECTPPDVLMSFVYTMTVSAVLSPVSVLCFYCYWAAFCEFLTI
jgi:hypothetical protein